MKSIITLMGSSKSMGLSENSCVVSLRNGSGDCEDDDPFEVFLLTIVFILRADLEVLEGDEEAIVAGGQEFEDHKNIRRR